MSEYVYSIENLGCPNCAASIERKAKRVKGVADAQVDFSTAIMKVKAQEGDEPNLFSELDRIVRTTEQGATLSRAQTARKTTPAHEHNHDHGSNCACDHDHAEHAHENAHSHTHSDVISAEQTKVSGVNRELLQVGLGILLFIGAIAAPFEGYWRLAAFLVPYFVLGWQVIVEAVQNLFGGHIMDENFLMSVATVGAFAIGDYPEAVAVMLFYRVGEYFQGLAVARSRKSVDALAKLRVDNVHVIRDGSTVDMQPEDVQVGAQISIRPGERVPVDCQIVEGESFADTSAITGETVPRRITQGDSILAGYLNKEGTLVAEVTSRYEDSEISNIMRLTKQALGNKAKTEQFITRFAKIYTPVVVGLAVLTAVLPPLLTGAAYSVWIYKALSFLVISCPCALVISVPLAYYAGLGMASRRGMLAKGGEVFEDLAEANAILFDKTGTLTQGVFHVSQVDTYQGYEREQVMAIAAALEAASNHPVARSICDSFDGESIAAEQVTEVAGKGISATIDGKAAFCGNNKLMNDNSVKFEATQANGTAVYVALDGQHIGTILVSDELRPDAVAMLASLKRKGIRHIGMLTGDSEVPAKAIAAQLGIDDVQHSLLPADKLNALMTFKSGSDGKVIYAGDGINDAPVLAAADTGIAMGGMGQDAAIESADAVLMTDSLTSISDGISIARFTRRIVLQNIGFSLLAKLIVLVLAIVSTVPVFLAVFADVGVALLAVLNSIRILRMKKF